MQIFRETAIILFALGIATAMVIITKKSATSEQFSKIQDKSILDTCYNCFEKCAHFKVGVSKEQPEVELPAGVAVMAQFFVIYSPKPKDSVAGETATAKIKINLFHVSYPTVKAPQMKEQLLGTDHILTKTRQEAVDEARHNGSQKVNFPDIEQFVELYSAYPASEFLNRLKVSSGNADQPIVLYEDAYYLPKGVEPGNLYCICNFALVWMTSDTLQIDKINQLNIHVLRPMDWTEPANVRQTPTNNESTSETSGKAEADAADTTNKRTDNAVEEPGSNNPSPTAQLGWRHD